MRLSDLIAKHSVHYCLDCGKCAAVCPITAQETRSYASPRVLVEQSLNDGLRGFYDNLLFWSCLTCQRCSQLCPSTVSFSGFIRDLRALARTDGRSSELTHNGVIQTWGRMMAAGQTRQERLGWLDGGLKTDADAETLLFVGCLPHYDVLFEHLNIDGIAIAQAAISLLNQLGIHPQVSGNERCCGHDQLWAGDHDTFNLLAQANIENILNSGAKRIVTTCPECARTLALDYPRLSADFDLPVLHLSQFLSEHLDTLRPQRPKDMPRVTLQDACRLGRHLGELNAPRSVLTQLGAHLVEMQHSRQGAVCCGTTCWQSCGQVSKAIQQQRLAEAVNTGAELMITTCIKCQIHLKCAQQSTDLGAELMALPIRDLTVFTAERLAAERPAGQANNA